ncbi:MAG: hypothetical protein LBB84_12920 [Tannerellaceae bacterium]|jgi:hypothetical protein|nr:hypothetical protein [Tannerellaceae bacterium]
MNDFTIVLPVLACNVKQSGILDGVIANNVKQSSSPRNPGLLHFVRNDEVGCFGARHYVRKDRVCCFGLRPYIRKDELCYFRKEKPYFHKATLVEPKAR